MRLVLLGPPGSGKGTQARVLAERYGIPHLSSGELLRRHAAHGDVLGQRVASHLDRGELVPDDLAVSVVAEAVAGLGAAGGYILDGFPRTVAQARRADAADPTGGIADAVVHIAIPDEVARDRLARRAGAEGRSDDARPEVIDHRIAVYHDETEPLLAYYRQQGLLVTVDGTPAPDAVAAAVAQALASGVAAPGAGRERHE